MKTKKILATLLLISIVSVQTLPYTRARAYQDINKMTMTPIVGDFDGDGKADFA